MKTSRFILPLLILCTGILTAGNSGIKEKRKTFTIHINQVDFSIRAEVLSDNSEVKVKPGEDITYCWYAANKIMQTKGGFDGRLLHGEYSCFFSNNNLKEKGSYIKGLKTGKWITWYSNGKIMEINYWKNGKKNGRYVLYNEYGDKMVEARFKDEKLHGTFNTYQKDKIISVKKYKNGDEIIKVPKTEKATLRQDFDKAQSGAQGKEPEKKVSEKPQRKAEEKESVLKKIKKYFSKDESDKRKAERLKNKTTKKLKNEGAKQ